MEYDKYGDKLRAQNKSMYIDGIWEILFGYSYVKLRLAEGADENHTDKKLVYAGRAFKLLNLWVILKFDSAKDNIYPLKEFFSWIDEDAIFEKIQSEVPEYEIPERATEFMTYVRDAQKYPLNVGSALKFIRKAEFWEIGFEKIEFFKHRKGLTYLQFLLSHPHESYSCHALLQVEPAHDEVCRQFFEKNPEHTAPSPEEPEEIARQLKADLTEMQRELQEAEDNYSPDVDILREEVMKTEKYYNALYDNKGRPRDVGSQDEKARKAVAKALKGAKDVLLKDLPELEPILSKVSSGLNLEYSPKHHPVEIITGPLRK